MSKERTDLVKAIKEKGKTIEAEMSFFDHLDVLRGASDSRIHCHSKFHYFGIQFL